MFKKPIIFTVVAIISALSTGCGESSDNPLNAPDVSTTTSSIYTTTTTTSKATETTTVTKPIIEYDSEYYKDAKERVSNLEGIYEDYSITEELFKAESTAFTDAEEIYIFRALLNDTNISYNLLYKDNNIYVTYAGLKGGPFGSLDSDYYVAYNSFKKDPNINRLTDNIVDKKKARELNKQYLIKLLSAAILYDSNIDLKTIDQLTEWILNYLDIIRHENIKSSAFDPEEKYYPSLAYFKYDDFLIRMNVSYYTWNRIPYILDDGITIIPYKYAEEYVEGDQESNSHLIGGDYYAYDFFKWEDYDPKELENNYGGRPSPERWYPDWFNGIYEPIIR